MNELKIGAYRDRLMKRREVVITTLRHLQKEHQGVDDNKEWIDHAAYESRVGLLTNLTDWYIKERGQIDDALTRIEESTYGFCLACHNPIAFKRLEVAPTAAFCEPCQELRECLAAA